MLLYTIVIPIIILFTGLMIYEIKTGIIPNEVTLPLAIYLMIITPLFGHLSIGNHWASIVVSVVIFIYANKVFEAIAWSDTFGWGTIKLFAALSVAMGVQESLISVTLFIILVAIVGLLVRNRVEYVASTPLLLLSIGATYIWYFRDYILEV